MLDLVGLGILAGVVPVYLGIAAALVLRRALPRTWEAGLIGLSTGVLTYLFFDLMHEAVELMGVRDPFSWLLFLGSLFLSFVGLVHLEKHQFLKGRHADQALTLPFVIAAGMGLHNLGEGLAIGTSYAGGEWALSGLLVAGFALHNGTEGFGIVGAAGQSPIPPRTVVLLGLTGGAPTCIGTVLSGLTVSPYLSLVWYALAAGSLLYVVFALVAMTYTSSRKVHMAYGVWTGIALMAMTAMFLTLVGGHRS
ncbi:MAG TPA: zinc transporter ZupT [Nitrospira sp.]|jgi:ZIP family zinc transporter|nr:zinc transporter ZupT [Nitrospira sp.]HNV32016.1 zinc transporter ZupT [Nitrospira sp.]HPW16388.1 zinc transporter ZupT [Nitrospira sp.]HQV45071.1 zinc transporter ZupT [Nitrospira sp.]HQW89400.1 zinc transporter ZupT [Nitrospira sp.]